MQRTPDVQKLYSCLTSLAGLAMLVLASLGSLPIAQAAPLQTYTFASGQWTLLKTGGPAESAHDDMVMFFTEVTIDGTRKPLKIDTGSLATILMPDAKVSAYTAQDTNQVTGLAGAQTCDVIHVETFGLDHSVKHHSVAERCKQGDNSGGTLGLENLSGQVLSLNTSDARLDVLEHVPDKKSQQPLHRNSASHLMIPARVGSQDAATIFDTGASLTAVDLHYVKAHPDLFTALAASPYPMRDLNQRDLQTQFYRMHDLQIGKLHLHDVLVVVVDLSTIGIQPAADLLLGANAIARADWILDLKENTWSVNPHS